MVDIGQDDRAKRTSEDSLVVVVWYTPPHTENILD